MIIFRVFSRENKPIVKWVHMTIQTIAFVFGVVGLNAAFDFHNYMGFNNVYSLHSWIGLVAFVLFTCQVCFVLFTCQVCLNVKLLWWLACIHIH